MTKQRTRIYLDLETLPLGEPDYSDCVDPDSIVAERVDIDTLQPPKNYKDEAKIAAWKADNLAKAQGKAEAEAEKQRDAARKQREKVREDWARGSLNSLRGRILVVGIAVDDGEVVTLCDEDERAMLALVDKGLARYPDHLLVTFNGSGKDGFDVPYLCDRAVACRLPRLSAALNLGLQAKPWESPFLDLRDCWKNGNFRKKGTLDEVCAHFNVSRLDNPIKGSEVLEHYERGDVETVRQHCAADVRDLRDLHCEMEIYGYVPSRYR